jgi:hypothetical protein
MDPDEALRKMRRALKKYGDGLENGDTEEALVVSARALDEWLSKGGFLPEAWKGDRK